MRLFIHCPWGTPGPPEIGTGCGALEWLDLADSRPAYEAMRAHLSGRHGGFSFTPEEVARMLSGLRVYEPLLLGPDEKSCGALCDHGPHDERGGRCYGGGPFREVPERETWPPMKEEN